ncbi:MAG: hypothetical protein Q9225_002076 [Loekoesia sp. 1 TL-2023]
MASRLTRKRHILYQILNTLPMTRVDPPSHPEPRIPPEAHPPYLLLRDKAHIDADYLSFSVVWQRLWPSYLQEPLEDFCRARGPHIFHKELLYEEVRKLLDNWKNATAVGRVVVPPNSWSYTMGAGWTEEEVRAAEMECVRRARIEYERTVRWWHVGEHLEKYQVRAAGELRRMGYKIGL